jgi:hypothetical protein
MSVEKLDRDSVSQPEGDWRAVADELAGALQQTMLRNPNLTARGWGLAQAALQRYERTAGGLHSVPAEVREAAEG